jgi:ankyrin repeat protein
MCMFQLLNINSNTHKTKRGKDGRTPLIQASFDGKVEEVKALLKYGADVNAIDKVSYI